MDSSSWFPQGQNNTPGWRLDVVTLLAVIGESNIADQSQAMTSSIFCLLPRIIPAPQALLRPVRPLRLPDTRARLIGVRSGVSLESLNYFTSIIHPLDHLPAFSFRVLRIRHADSFPRDGNESLSELPSVSRRNSKLFRSSTEKSDTGSNRDFEPGGVSRRRTLMSIVTQPTTAFYESEPTVTPRLLSPLHIIAVFSFGLTIALTIFAGITQDGCAILALIFLSVASSVVGYARWWRPVLMQRAHKSRVPEGDVIIRTREGAFILVKCDEEVARELYSGTEECRFYAGKRTSQFLMGLGTLLLMVSVILMGNCNWNSQVAIGVSYIFLNGAHWLAALIPDKYFWDLSRYSWQDVTPQDAVGAHDTTDPDDVLEGGRSYTRTLWYAIRETKTTGWVEKSGAAPVTKSWKKWLQEAKTAALNGNRKWRAVTRKDALMNGPDPAEQPPPIAEEQSE